MSLCPPIPNQQLSQYIPPPSEIAPLVVKFSKDCVPMGCFSSTISCLMAMHDWRLSRSEDGSPECLAHNVVSLYDPQLPVQIILVDRANHLEIHVQAEPNIRCTIPQVCFRIQETVFSAINKVFDIMHLSEIEISHAFICPCPLACGSHSASVRQFDDSTWFLRCSKTGKSLGSASENHKFWLDSQTTEKNKPSLPKLLEHKIPEAVGPNYKEFGTLLLNDVTGSLVDAIERDCNYYCHRITKQILQEWIKNKERAPTWQMLIQTLRKCNLNTLADQIQRDRL